ncbi:MAG: hypothetical protein WD066_16915 [Planctomycetaceae bacterium]
MSSFRLTCCVATLVIGIASAASAAGPFQHGIRFPPQPAPLPKVDTRPSFTPVKVPQAKTPQARTVAPARRTAAPRAAYPRVRTIRRY